VALTVCGAALGALWARIAPPIHTITALTRSGERVDAFLGAEADNLFVAAAMMIGLLVMLAIVAAVAVWQWRAHRGPVLATAGNDPGFRRGPGRNDSVVLRVPAGVVVAKVRLSFSRRRWLVC
jgi:hypothetical protein